MLRPRERHDSIEPEHAVAVVEHRPQRLGRVPAPPAIAAHEVHRLDLGAGALDEEEACHTDQRLPVPLRLQLLGEAQHEIVSCDR